MNVKPAIGRNEETPARRARVALDMTMDGFGLMERAPQGWVERGRLSINEEDFEGRMAAFRVEIMALAGDGPVEIWLPADQVLVAPVEPGEGEGRGQRIRKALSAATPHPLSEFIWDASPRDPEGRRHVAATWRRTVEEARGFAAKWRIPVARVTTRVADAHFPDGPDFALEPELRKVAPAPKPATARAAPRRTLLLGALGAGAAAAVGVAAYLLLDGGLPAPEGRWSAPAVATAPPAADSAGVDPAPAAAAPRRAEAALAEPALTPEPQPRPAPDREPEVGDMARIAAAPARDWSLGFMPAGREARRAAPAEPAAPEGRRAPPPGWAAPDAPPADASPGAPTAADPSRSGAAIPPATGPDRLPPPGGAGLAALPQRLPDPAAAPVGITIAMALAAPLASPPPPEPRPAPGAADQPQAPAADAPATGADEAAGETSASVPPPPPGRPQAAQTPDDPRFPQPRPTPPGAEAEAPAETPAEAAGATAATAALAADAEDEGPPPPRPSVAIVSPETPAEAPAETASATAPAHPGAAGKTEAPSDSARAPPRAKPGTNAERVRLFTAAKKKARAAAETEARREASRQTVRRGGPTPASVAAAATTRDAIDLEQTALIGVFGSSAARRALIRLPDGELRRVRLGDQLGGWQVAAIGQSSVRLKKGGRNLTLNLPGQ